MVQANKYLFSVLIFMLACLATACVSKELPETAVNSRQEQAGAEDRYCLRALWVKDPKLMEHLSERLKQGEGFITLARQAARQHPGKVKDRTSCLGAGDMEPALVGAVRDLEPGQTAGPISLKQGLVLVRVTTDAHFQKGKKLLQSGRPQEAEEAFKKDVELNPDHLASWHLLGISRMGQGDRAGAVEAFDKGLSLAPGSPALLNDKASTLMDLKRRDEAIDSYRQALKITPNNPLLLNNLAWALAQDGKDLAQAEAMARKAVQIAPNQPSFWDTLGQVQKLRGEHAQAVVSFHRALALGKKTESTKEQLLSSLKSLDPRVISRLTGKGGTASPATPQPPAKVAASTEKKPDEKKTVPPVESNNTLQSLADSARPPKSRTNYQDTSLEVAPKTPQAPEQKNTAILSNFSKSKVPVLRLEGQPVMNPPPMSASALKELEKTGPVTSPIGETGQTALPESAKDSEDKPPLSLAPGPAMQKPSQEAKAQTPAQPVAPPVSAVPVEKFPPLFAMAGIGGPAPAFGGKGRGNPGAHRPASGPGPFDPGRDREGKAVPGSSGADRRLSDSGCQTRYGQPGGRTGESR